MKALHCRNCNALHSLKASGDVTTCDCGRVKAWYTDATNGLAKVSTSVDDRELAQIFSLNNAWVNDGADLVPTEFLDLHTQKMVPYTSDQVDSFWRELNVQGAIMPRAPEQVRVWDASRRNCPIANITPGTQVDVQWE